MPCSASGAGARVSSLVGACAGASLSSVAGSSDAAAVPDDGPGDCLTISVGELVPSEPAVPVPKFAPACQARSPTASMAATAVSTHRVRPRADPGRGGPVADPVSGDPHGPGDGVGGGGGVGARKGGAGGGFVIVTASRRVAVSPSRRVAESCACSRTVRATGSGSHAAPVNGSVVCPALTVSASSASRSPMPGRLPGSLSRHRATSARSRGGSTVRFGCSWTIRNIRACADPVPNGPDPEAVNASTAPSEKTSLAVPTAAPVSCSGDMKPGVPTTTPVRVRALASPATEIPKSITRGPSVASSTFDGLRSRWISPAA